MNILMAFNSEYCKPAMVTMHSLLCNHDCEVVFYIIYSRLTEAEKDRISEITMAEGHGRCVFLQVVESTYADLPTLEWISPETYYRLLAQKLLPESVDRILWLDADVVICGDITEFYHQDLEGNLLAACSVMDEESYYAFLNQLTLPPDARYFNAGVLLYDLEAQRKKLDPDIYTRYLQVFGKRLIYGDQDVLNAVFYRCVKFAEPKHYNCTTYALDKLTSGERRKVLKDCRILHYNGSSKPWNPGYCLVSSDIFHRYASVFPEFSYLEAPEWEKQEKRARQRRLSYKRKHKESEEERLRYSFVIQIAGVKIRVVHRYQKVLMHCRKYLVPSGESELEVTLTREDLTYEKKQYEAVCAAEKRENGSVSDEELEISALNRKTAEALLDFHILLIHGAAVEVEGKAYLFCAKSGTGKTTHIEFWKELLGEAVTVINGDKPFLKIEEAVTVYGSPWCGKEGQNTNTSCPLAGICLLERGTKNEIRRLSPEEVFPRMMSHAYRFRDRGKAEQMMNLLSKLAEMVPFYGLKALPDVEAARLSYEAMRTE